MADEIHIITSGSYSDYSVHAAVADEATGQRIVDELNANNKYGDYTLETIPVTTGVTRVIVLHMQWRAIYKDDHEWTSTWDRFGNEDDGVSNNAVKFFSRDDAMFTVSGYDHDAVRKVFSEKKAEYVARLEGIS